MNDDEARAHFRKHIAPRIAQIKRAREREANDGLVHFTQVGAHDNRPKPALSDKQHAESVLAHVDDIWKRHSSPADAAAAAKHALPYSDIKRAHEYATGEHASDAMASRAAKLRVVMLAHKAAGTANENAPSHVGPASPGYQHGRSDAQHAEHVLGRMDALKQAHGGDLTKAAPAIAREFSHADLKRASDFAQTHGDDKMASRAVPLRVAMKVHEAASAASGRSEGASRGAVQTGARGGRFIMLPSGKRLYVQSQGGQLKFRKA